VAYELSPILCAAALGLAVAGATAPARAQSAPRVPGSVPVAALLSDTPALVAWLEKSQPDLAAAAARVREARAAVGVSRQLPNPELDLGVSGITIGQRNPPNLPYQDTLAYTVGISQTIELGKRGPRIEAASLRRQAAEQAYRDVLAEKVAEARDALARVVYFRARQQVLEERLQSARDMEKLDLTRLEHGDVSGIDHDRLMLDAASVEREVADDRADYEDALADCAAALLAPCAPGAANMTAVDAAAPVPADLSSVERALAERPDVRALRLASVAAADDAKLWRRQAIPDPTIGVAYTRDFLVYAGDQPNALSVTLTLPLPIFDHGQNQARQSEGQSAELEWQARALEVRGQSKARALVARRDILQRKLAILERSVAPKSNAVLKSTVEAYRHGEISMTDLLLVRREHQSVLLDVTDTRYALFSARNELRRLLGLDVASGAGR
jgi:outer membrane protein, heavy metal efflux system